MSTQGKSTPVTNREDWIASVQVRNDDGELVDLTGGEIVLSVQDKNTLQNVLTATTTAGTITITGLGMFEFTFTVDQMRGLAAKTYSLGSTVKLNGVTQQLFVGDVPVLDGIVP
jgi:hypothetical protein